MDKAAMRVKWLLVIAGAVAASPCATPAIQAQAIRSDFFVANERVRAVALSGNTLYMGGDFTQIGPATGAGVPLDGTTGVPVNGFPKVTGVIFAVAPDGASGWYIGGAFTSVGGIPRSNVTHILADNSVDVWNPNANRGVEDLAVSGSTVYVAGFFTSIGGAARNGIAALDAATGQAAAWDPGANNGADVSVLALSGSTVYVAGLFTAMGGQARNSIAALDATTGQATPWDPNPTLPLGGSIAALAVSGSTVYAGGYFTGIGGQPRKNIAALNATIGQATAWNPNANYPVEALALEGSTVYAGGVFTNIGGQPRNSVAALDATTGQATAWDPNVENAMGPQGEVNALAASGSTVYVGGWFTSVGGQARNHLAGLDATTGQATLWDPNPNRIVRALAVSGSAVYAGGDFTSVGGQARNHLAALNATTGQVKAWNPSAAGDGYPPYVTSLAVSGSTVYVGGYFTNVGGHARNHIAALDAITGQATDWDPNPNLNPFDPINALAVNGSTVVVGGTFSSIGGQPRNNIAALDATTALATGWDPSADGPVLTVAVSASTVYAGGDFSTVGGQTRNHIAALGATTAFATDWDPSADGPVLTLAVSASTVYAGGEFSAVAGQARNNIAALDATTGLATLWDPDADGAVYALALSGPTTYVGGAFTAIGGQARSRAAALDAATGQVTDWNPEANLYFTPGRVEALAVSGSTVFLGGDFEIIGGLPQSYIAAVGDLTTATQLSLGCRAKPGPAHLVWCRSRWRHGDGVPARFERSVVHPWTDSG